METKTCKICDETKAKDKFKHRICWTCTYKRLNDLRIKNHNTELPDIYLKRVLVKSNKLKDPLFEISMITPEMIIEQRTRILQKRKAKAENKRYCSICKIIKDHKEFQPIIGKPCLVCKRKESTKWKKNNPEKVKAINNNLRQQRINLTDYHISCTIRKNLNENHAVKISVKNIPKEFIDLKRKEILTKRLIKSLNNSNGNKNL